MVSGNLFRNPALEAKYGGHRGPDVGRPRGPDDRLRSAEGRHGAAGHLNLLPSTSDRVRPTRCAPSRISTRGSRAASRRARSCVLVGRRHGTVRGQPNARGFRFVPGLEDLAGEDAEKDLLKFRVVQVPGDRVGYAVCQIPGRTRMVAALNAYRRELRKTRASGQGNAGTPSRRSSLQHSKASANWRGGVPTGSR